MPSEALSKSPSARARCRLQSLPTYIACYVAVVALAVVASGVWLLGWPNSYSHYVLDSPVFGVTKTPTLWRFLARSRTRLRVAGVVMLALGLGMLALAASWR